ncbi:MAG: trypsin-like serine protease, partial [Pseudorhodoplanes sp.]
MTRIGFAPAAGFARLAFVAAISFFVAAAYPDDANAVIKGTSSSADSYTVRVIRGGIRCSGVAIGRKLVATARHCGHGTVIAGGRHIGLSGSGTSAVLDDGRRVSVSGDASILRLAAPLPASITPVAVGDGGGDTYTIAGYGTADERYRGAFGQLREARLVSAERYALVDPNRSGSISASACFGDSGGPVLRGSELVGIVTRAAHPSPRIA